MTANAERLAALEGDIDRAAEAHNSRAAADAWRAVLDVFDSVERGPLRPGTRGRRGRIPTALGPGQRARWPTSAARAEPPLHTVADYDSDRYGPMLGVSDEGSATAAIRRGRTAAPKCAALAERTPLTIGIAHDAERLGAVGEVAVGPDEFAAIRLACRGRVLTTTNVGQPRQRPPLPRFPDRDVRGATSDAIDAAVERLRRSSPASCVLPAAGPRPLTVLVRLDAALPARQRRHILARLRRLVASGSICQPEAPSHRAPRRSRQRNGSRRARMRGRHRPRRRATGPEEVAVEGLCERFGPDELAEIIKYAAGKKVRLRRREIVDPQTTARHVWTGLSVARNMGLELGKYGLAPLTFEEQAEVVARIQYWFPFWCAAPVFYVDNPLVTRDRRLPRPAACQRASASGSTWSPGTRSASCSSTRSTSRRVGVCSRKPIGDARGYLTAGRSSSSPLTRRDRGGEGLCGRAASPCRRRTPSGNSVSSAST